MPRDGWSTRHWRALARAFTLAFTLALTLALAGHGPAAAADAPAAEPHYLHIAAPGDTLIGLGRRLLADPSRWPEVARANALRNPDRIATGAELRIPLRLMRVEAASARVQSVAGQARSGGAPLAAGQAVPEGGDISTGDDGHVSVRLVDGTLLRLRPGSRLQLNLSNRLPDAQVVRSGARLERGRVEVEAAPAPAGRPGFRIETPQGVLGVRGTEFRVAADGEKQVSRGEVLGGAVAFDGRGGAAQVRVDAGFGSVIDTAGGVLPPVRLLGPVDTAALPTLQERLLMRFALTPLPGAAAYRGQIARDGGFDLVVAELTSTAPELRFAELPDGDYVLRVRAIDERGLEGQDRDHRFRLKARPEAPLPSAPPPRRVSIGDRVDFAWTANAEADRYRLRLVAAAGPVADFTNPLRDLKDLRQLAITLDGLTPGSYFWQLASVRADGDQGPWGDARSFELRPPPPTPAPPKVSEDGVAFAWEGRPGQTFEFQVARDAAFAALVLERTLAQPALELPLPGSGRFHVRLRAIDADGFVGPYTTPQYFDIPNCVRSGSGGCVRAGPETLNLAE